MSAKIKKTKVIVGLIRRSLSCLDGLYLKKLCAALVRHRLEYTAQKMMFSVKDFFIFCAVILSGNLISVVKKACQYTWKRTVSRY